MTKPRYSILGIIVLLSACATPVSAPAPYSSPPGTDTHQTVPAGIPREFVPAPGNCRIWYPDRPPDEQPPTERCLEIPEIPPGSRLVYGGALIKTYRIEEYDPQDPGVVNTVNYFELESGRFLRQEKICK